MCMVCVDETVIGIGLVIAACPWYRAIWRKVKGCAENLRRIA